MSTGDSAALKAPDWASSPIRSTSPKLRSSGALQWPTVEQANQLGRALRVTMPDSAVGSSRHRPPTCSKDSLSIGDCCMRFRNGIWATHAVFSSRRGHQHFAPIFSQNRSRIRIDRHDSGYSHIQAGRRGQMTVVPWRPSGNVADLRGIQPLG
jgi:hypothetical protein